MTSKFMKRNKPYFIIGTIAIIASLIASGAITGFFTAEQESNQALIKTSMGDITVELYSDKAPITVDNFRSYINDNFYDGTIFHRVIDGFMIQGGGFLPTGEKKETKDPIKLEVNNELKNEKYTIAMARTLFADSATAQFFINSETNSFLDNQYAVFGKVIKGQEVVDKIEKVQTRAINKNVKDWPVENVIIESIELI